MLERTPGRRWVLIPHRGQSHLAPSNCLVARTAAVLGPRMSVSDLKGGLACDFLGAALYSGAMPDHDSRRCLNGCLNGAAPGFLRSTVRHEEDIARSQCDIFRFA